MQKLLVLGLALALTLNSYSFYDNDSSAFYGAKAKEFWANKNVWEADKSFQKAVEFDTADNDLSISYADFLIAQRKYYQAGEQYQRVLAQNSHHPVALEKMLNLHFAQGRWNDAISYANRLLPNSSSSDVKYKLGKAYYATENYGPAKKFLSEALTENPKNAEAAAVFANVLVELGDYKQAMLVYEKAVELNPDNSQLIYQLGLLHFSMEHKKEAAGYFELAAQKGYKADLVYYENIGMAYLNFDVDKGVEALNKVLERKPGNAEILFQIAQGYYKAKRYQEAGNTYVKVYEGDTSHSRALYMAGVAFQKSGDKGKGIAFCEKAIAMDPSLAHLKTEEKPEN